MPLTWDVKDIENYEEKFPETKEGNWNPITEAITWLSLGCGFNRITKENLEMVAERVIASELAFGPILRRGDGMDVPITYEQIKGHVGYKSNASVKKPAEFLKHLGAGILDKAKREIAKEKQ